MKHSRYRTIRCLGISLLLSIFAVPAAIAAGLSVSGTYEIAGKSDLGSNLKVTLRFHLTNHEASDVSLQGSLLSDFAYPHSRGSLAGEITLRPGATQQVVQEFVVPRTEYEQWKRGLRPRVLLEFRTGSGARITEAVRLEQLPTGKGK